MFLCVVSVIICNHCFGRVSFGINALLLLDTVVLLILVNKINTPIKQEHACYCHGLTHTVHHDSIGCTVWGWKVLKVIESWKTMSLCQVQECPVRQWRGWPAAAAALWHCEGRLPKARSRISHPTTIIVKLSCSPVTNLSSCPLSGVVTIQTLSFSSTTMTVTEQRQIFPLLFGKILAFEKGGKGQCWRNEENGFKPVVKYFQFHTCNGGTFLLSWTQFLPCLGLMYWKVKSFQKLAVG